MKQHSPLQHNFKCVFKLPISSKQKYKTNQEMLKTTFEVLLFL